MIGQHHDVAVIEPGLLQQFCGPRNRTIRTTAIDWHHVRLERVEKHRDIAGVIGQRRDRVGVIGERDQAHLATGARAQQGRDLGARLQQPRRWQVIGECGAGQVQRDHQRCAVLPQRQFDALP